MNIPPWLLGRHVSTIQITPYVLDEDGVLQADESVSSLIGTIDEIEIDSEVASENISPMDTRTSHHEPVEDDFALVFTEVLKTGNFSDAPRTGGNFNCNVFVRLYTSWDFFYITISRGTQSWGAWMSRGSYTEGLRKGKSSGRAQARRINVYSSGIIQANPTLDVVAAPAY